MLRQIRFQFLRRASDQILEASAVVFDTDKFVATDFPSDPDGPITGANFLKLVSAYLSYHSYDAPLSRVFEDGDRIGIQFSIETSKRTAEADQATPAISTAETGPHPEGSFRHLVLKIERQALERDLAELLAGKLREPLQFEPVLNLDLAQVQDFRALAISIAALGGSIVRGSGEPTLLLRLEQVLRLAALYCCPNNYSGGLAETPGVAAPRQVRFVEEWIDAHWREDVSVKTLVEVSGLSARSIFAAFKASRNYSPMQYVKRVRLRAAREMLLHPEPGTTVTGVAFACAFSNPGHFSKYYLEVFAELPSLTLATARSRL